MRKKGRKIVVLCFLVFTLICAGCGSQQFRTALFSPYENKVSLGPNGMAWNGRDLILGALGQTVYARDIHTKSLGIVENFLDPVVYYQNARYPFKIPGKPRICGLAWEGACCEDGFLWVADSDQKQIVKLDYYHTVIKSFPSPGQSPNGLTFDGRSLWVADVDSGVIHKVSTTDGRVLKTVESPVSRPTGLAWDCFNLWVLGMNTCKRGQAHCYAARLLKLDLERGVATHEIKLPEPVKRPNSLEWVDGTFWVGDSLLNRVFRFPDVRAHKLKVKVYVSVQQPTGEFVGPEE